MVKTGKERTSSKFLSKNFVLSDKTCFQNLEIIFPDTKCIEKKNDVRIDI